MSMYISPDQCSLEDIHIQSPKAIADREASFSKSALQNFGSMLVELATSTQTFSPVHGYDIKSQSTHHEAISHDCEAKTCPAPVEAEYKVFVHNEAGKSTSEKKQQPERHDRARHGSDDQAIQKLWTQSKDVVRKSRSNASLQRKRTSMRESWLVHRY